MLIVQTSLFTPLFFFLTAFLKINELVHYLHMQSSTDNAVFCGTFLAHYSGNQVHNYGPVSLKFCVVAV